MRRIAGSCLFVAVHILLERQVQHGHGHRGGNAIGMALPVSFSGKFRQGFVMARAAPVS